jgi:hypothetical protein
MLGGVADDEVADIMTNLLACTSNYPEAIESVEKL